MAIAVSIPTVISSLLGVAVGSVTTGTTTDGENAPFALGTRVTCTNGTEVLMVQAGAAISTLTTTPFVLAIDENFQAVKITKALANAGYMLAVAPPIVIADNDIFWAIVKGTAFNVKVAVSCAADAALWTTATAGILDDTSGASHVRVMGIVIVVSASASQSAGSTVREAIVNNGGMLVPGLIA